MRRSTLASKLVNAKSAAEMRRLLKSNAEIADLKLAHDIKEICYAAWAAEPAAVRKALRAMKELAVVSPRQEILAFEAWTDGIADITLGRLEPASEKLRRSSTLFRKARDEHGSAQPLVALLIALAMLGRYGEATATGRKALRIFTKHGDELAAGKIEMNLSNIASRRERHREAEAFCLSAHRRFLRLKETHWQAMAENGLANTYAELNDFRRAESFYARALATAHSAKMDVTEAEILASMGNLALFRDRNAEALDLLERSRRIYENLRMPHQSAIAELEIADIYAELNLGAEAGALYRKSISTLNRLKLAAEEARARMNLGQTALRLRDYSVARRELEKALRLFEKEKNNLGIASVRLAQARLAMAVGRPKAALVIAGGISKKLKNSEHRRHYLSALWLRGASLAAIGKRGAAMRVLDRALADSLSLEQTNIARASLNILGTLSPPAEAEGYFRRAIELTENSRRPLPGEEFRIAFLADKLQPYENLAQLYLKTNRWPDALQTIEDARSRSLLETVVGNHAEAPAADPFSRKALQLREELNWLYSRLDFGDGDNEKLEFQARKRERELSSLMRRSRSTSDGRTANNAPTEARFDLQNLCGLLGPGRALLEFVNFGGKFSVFVVTGERVDYFADLASEKEVAPIIEGLHFQFGSLRYGKSLQAFARQLRSRTDELLGRLYSLLLKRPFESIPEGMDLVIVPAGLLNLVPFHALHDGRAYVIESRTLSYAPSAAIWQKLNQKPARKIRKALLVGFADEQIPFVYREIETLATKFPKAKVLSGRDATFSAFTANAGGKDLIHLGCHGRFRPDNPLFSSLHLADGWVTVRDVTDRKIDAELVTLSACETGVNKIQSGEEILGLSRGFLSAGARHLVLSLWPVNDDATVTSMRDFYTELQRGRTIAASLRLAQNAFIARGEHPYYWAPFICIG